MLMRSVWIFFITALMSIMAFARPIEIDVCSLIAELEPIENAQSTLSEHLKIAKDYISKTSQKTSLNVSTYQIGSYRLIKIADSLSDNAYGVVFVGDDLAPAEWIVEGECVKLDQMYL